MLRCQPQPAVVARPRHPSVPGLGPALWRRYIWALVWVRVLGVGPAPAAFSWTLPLPKRRSVARHRRGPPFQRLLPPPPNLFSHPSSPASGAGPSSRRSGSRRARLCRCRRPRSCRRARLPTTASCSAWWCLGGRVAWWVGRACGAGGWGGRVGLAGGAGGWWLCGGAGCRLARAVGCPGHRHCRRPPSRRPRQCACHPSTRSAPAPPTSHPPTLATPFCRITGDGTHAREGKHVIADQRDAVEAFE